MRPPLADRAQWMATSSGSSVANDGGGSAVRSRRSPFGVGRGAINCPNETATEEERTVTKAGKHWADLSGSIRVTSGTVLYLTQNKSNLP